MDPLTLAYLAIMLAGTGAQYMGAKKADNERAKAMAEERDRRMKLTKQNEATADQSKQIFSNVRQDEAARAGQIAQQISSTPVAPTTSPTGDVRVLDPNSGSMSQSVVGDPATAASDVNKRLAARAQALGTANSFGSVLGDYGRVLGRNAQDIDMNTTSMRNWANNVLPARMEYANQSGRQWNTAGDVLKLVGTVMAPWALGGGAANTAANSTTGVLDKMSGVPKEFAGADLFGANAMGINATRAFGSSLGLEGAGAGAGAAGLVSSEAYSRALWKQLSGIALTQAERDLLLRQQLQ